MTTEITNSQPATHLALLRYVVLRILEQKALKSSSTGLSAKGQADLSFVFPRTPIIAAVAHALVVARDEHDDKIHDRGHYHLFRLSTFWEAQTHQAARQAYQKSTLSSAETSEELFGLLADLPSLTAVDPAPQGPVDLGELDLTNADALAILAGTYRSALDTDNYVIPFFRLPQP